jgi:hypothetical protein
LIIDNPPTHCAAGKIGEDKKIATTFFFLGLIGVGCLPPDRAASKYTQLRGRFLVLLFGSCLANNSSQSAFKTLSSSI